VTFLRPNAEHAVPQEQQDASPMTASMLIRASAQGSAEAQGYISSPIRAAGRICVDGQGQVPGHSYNCAVGATGRMTWAEVGFGTGARTERACSPSVWRARGRRQRGRFHLPQAVLRLVRLSAGPFQHIGHAARFPPYACSFRAERCAFRHLPLNGDSLRSAGFPPPYARRRAAFREPDICPSPVRR
jgi:hypothetical protein